MIFSSVVGAIRRRPSVFNGITGGILCASSDMLAQQYEQMMKHEKQNKKQQQQQQQQCRRKLQQQHEDDNDSCSVPHHNAQHQLLLDYRRVVSAGLIGIFFGGVVYPRAYQILDTLYKGKSVSLILKKSIIEIFTVGIFVNSTSMTSRGILEGDKHPRKVWKHTLSELPTVTRNDILVWLPYNMVAFSIIPPMIRPTTTLLMEASWQCYISLRSHDYCYEYEIKQQRQHATMK